jgi:pyruvate formate lyase activating enzyme
MPFIYRALPFGSRDDGRILQADRGYDRWSYQFHNVDPDHPPELPNPVERESERMTQGIIFDIKKFAIHDGPGIRTTVFLKGCPLDCWWCHNPEGRHTEPESMATGTSGDAPGDAVPVGTRMSVDAIMAEIEKDRLFYDESGGGVTFSGGEPLAQPDFLAALLNGCRAQGIHTALDTSGYATPEIMARIAPLVDLFLYDLKLMDDRRHQTYTGLSNACILANLRYLAQTGRKVVIRFPLIPQINDTSENLARMGAFLTDLGLQRIDLLPFHGIHRQKYHRLGRPDRLGNLEPPGEATIARVKADFENGGFTVQVGG